MFRKILLLTLVLSALSFLALNVQVIADDTEGNVSVNNAAPSVGTVTLADSDGGNIQLTASSNTNAVTCNSTLTDDNGYADIDTASATFYHSSSSSDASDDKNVHYANSSCVLSGGSGTTVLATCTVNLEHEAQDGTWTCNITADDGTNATSNTGTATVDTLAALEVTEATINFGAMSLGENSSSAQSITISNEGNVQIDSRFSGSNYTCGIGVIPASNMRYSTALGNYDSMVTDLTNAAVTQEAFNLGLEGVATVDDTPSTKSEYWAILIPATGVGGACSNTVTVTAISG